MSVLKPESTNLEHFIDTLYDRFTLLEKSSLTWVFSRSFSVPCAAFSMLGSPGGTDCDGVSFPLHIDCNSRDVCMGGVCDCVKECVSFIM